MGTVAKVFYMFATVFFRLWRKNYKAHVTNLRNLGILLLLQGCLGTANLNK